MNKIKSFLWDNKNIILMLSIAAVYVVVLRYAFNIFAAPLEIFGMVFTVIEFDLFRREKSSAFVFNIIKCILLAIWFTSIGLYGQVAFRTIFAVLSLVGMFMWMFPRTMLNKRELRPAWLPRRFAGPIWAGILVVGLIILSRFNIITAMDWIYVLFGTIGNILLVFKRTDAWVLFLTSELVGLPLFFLTESWMFVLITVFMIFIEIGALKSWSKVTNG